MKVLACFNALASNGGRYPVSLNEDLQAFNGALARGLENLDRSMSENFISFQWLKEALNLLKAMHAGVILLVEKLDLPVSLKGEEWLNDYMDETLKLLDICNALKVGISGLEHYQMVVELALIKLNGLEKAVPLNSRVLNDLDACKEEAGRLNADKQKIIVSKKLTDGRLKFCLNEKNLQSKFVKWNGFWGVMFAVKNVTSLISWFLISGLVYPLPLDPNSNSDKVSFQSQWSTSFLNLYLRFNEELEKNRKGNGSSSLLLRELESLETITTDLRDRIQVISNGNHTSTPEDLGEFQKSIQLFKKKSSAFKEDLETIDWLVRNLFNEIGRGRNKLLRVLADSM